jgi:hypothetical protein
MKYSILTAVFIFVAITAAAHQPEISGTVIDQQTGEPLVGATVKHIESGLEVITDFDGNFTIPETSNGTHQLSISYVSYHEAKLNRVVVKDGEERILTIKMRRTQNNSTAQPAFTMQTASNTLS